MDKFKWLAKQLLPLIYKTYYIEDDRYYFCVWRMWLGKVYNDTTVEITQEAYKNR